MRKLSHALNMRDETTYPFLNFRPTLYWACDYLSMLRLKLNDVNEKRPWYAVMLIASLQLLWQSGINCSKVIMGRMASQITGVSITCSTVCSGADQRKHQSLASQAFARGIHRWPVDSPHKGTVIRKKFPFDDVIMHQLDLLAIDLKLCTVNWTNL